MSRRWGNGLDLLEAEDRRVLDLLARIDRNREQGVEDRARYGDLVKALIRSLGIRESAAVNVTTGLEEGRVLEPVAERLRAAATERRSGIDRVEKMGRGVPGVELRRGQDFDEELRSLSDTLTEQLGWELKEAIPAIRSAVPREAQSDLFRTAGYLRRHAPTSLDPEGSRWYERAPFVSRLISIVTHLRDFPTAARRVK